MSVLPPSRPVLILLVEDNEGDVLMTREAFEEGKVAVDLDVCESGQQAIDHLSAAMSAAGPPLPDMVLLDWNLPGRPGIDVLRWIRSTPSTEHLPVVVLTTSRAPEDVLSAYRSQANSFITKPVNADDFLGAIRSLESYWLTVVALPGRV